MKELSTTTTTTTTRRVSVIFALVLFIFFFVSAILTGLYHLSLSVLRFVFNLFLLCVLICYTFTSPLSLSLSLFLCGFTFCFVFFFLYILFVPQSLFSPLSFSASYRNKDIILLLLLFFTSFSSLHDCRSEYYGFRSTKFSSVGFEYHNSCSSSEASSH